MLLTDSQKMLVQETFKVINNDSDKVAALFYNHLFEVAPSFKSMFNVDMSEQGRKLMHIIGIAVTSLDHLELIVPALQSLGQRHVRYGVKRDDYDLLGETLLWTLAQWLGDDFTAEVEEAWAIVYEMLVNITTENAYQMA